MNERFAKDTWPYIKAPKKLHYWYTNDSKSFNTGKRMIPKASLLVNEWFQKLNYWWTNGSRESNNSVWCITLHEGTQKASLLVNEWFKKLNYWWTHGSKSLTTCEPMVREWVTTHHQSDSALPVDPVWHTGQPSTALETEGSRFKVCPAAVDNCF